MGKHCHNFTAHYVLDIFWEIFHHSKFTFTVIHNVFTCTQYLLAGCLCNVEHGGRSCTDYPRISPHRPPPRQAPTHNISRHCDYNPVSRGCTPTSCRARYCCICQLMMLLRLCNISSIFNALGEASFSHTQYLILP